MKGFLDSTCLINEELFNNVITEIITQIFNNIRSSSLSNNWPEAELGLHLLYIYIEGRNSKGIPIFVNELGDMNALGILISRMIESGKNNINLEISFYPHPSIPVTYFEVIIRCAQFFEIRDNYTTNVLQSFLDQRGLYNPIKAIRTRVNYLFLRYVKCARQVLGKYVESILTVLKVFFF